MQALRSRLLVVMGVAGCGKSTIGEELAAQLGGQYLEGDALHPAPNIDKMSNGIALTDQDRWPWLEQIGRQMGAQSGVLIAGCSALKRAYRDVITQTAGEPVTFIFLDGSRELIASRMETREGHFMPTSLLDSQFATLERPAKDENAIRIDIDASLEEIVENICSQLD